MSAQHLSTLSPHIKRFAIWSQHYIYELSLLIHTITIVSDLIQIWTSQKCQKCEIANLIVFISHWVQSLYVLGEIPLFFQWQEHAFRGDNISFQDQNVIYRDSESDDCNIICHNVTLAEQKRDMVVTSFVMMSF